MNLQALGLKKLRAFQLAAKHQSLRSAALQMQVTVPAISIQIAALERELGTKLLQRVGNRMMTTPSGALLVPEVDKIFKAVDGAIKAVSTKERPRERINIAIHVIHHFSDIIARFIRENPEVEVSLRVKRSAETLAMLMAGDIDLGVGYFDEVPPTIVKRTVGKSGFNLLFTPDYPITPRQATDLKELARHRLIVRTQSEIWQRMQRLFAEAGVEATRLVEAGNCLTCRDLAEKGIGVALVHTGCMDGKEAKTLRKVDFSGYLGRDDVAVIYRRTPALSTDQQHLLEMLTGTTR